MRFLTHWFVPAALCLLVFVGAVPTVTRHVTDERGVLPADILAEIETSLSDFQNRGGAQVAVVIVQTSEPITIEEMALKIGEAGKLGRVGRDDWVVLLVATDQRKLRIETGYGVEGQLPDAISAYIIRQVMTPQLKAGDLPGAVRAGAKAIVEVLENGELAPAKASDSAPEEGGGWIVPAIIGFIVGDALRIGLGAFAAGTVGGLIAGLGGALFLSALPAGLLGGTVFLLLLLEVGSRRYGGPWNGGHGRMPNDIFRSSGGGFGGGSFGLGSGRGGGGGASGSW